MLALSGQSAERARFIRFLAVGLLNTGVGYGLFALLTLAGLAPAAAAIGATILGALFNFQSIGRIVFGSSSGRLLLRFLLVYAAQCAANIALLRLAATARVPALLAEAAILPLLAVASFLLMRRYVFAAAPLGAAGR